MLSIAPYLTFNGNCREAMEFYRDCFGGKLQMQLLSDCPLTSPYVSTLGNIVVQARLQDENFCLLASDLVSEEGIANGNKVALQCRGTKAREVSEIFHRLAIGGQITRDYESQNETGLATLTDRYGIYWIFTYVAELETGRH